MWFSAIANYKGGLAHFKIVPENNDIFHAYLVRYDGRPDHIPPQTFILVRSVRQWSGSIEDQILLDKIGEVIDRRTKGRLHFQFDPLQKSRKGKQQ